MNPGMSEEEREVQAMEDAYKKGRGPVPWEPMSEERLAEIRADLEHGTPNPGDFVRHTRDLLDEVERLREERLGLCEAYGLPSADTSETLVRHFRGNHRMTLEAKDASVILLRERAEKAEAEVARLQVVADEAMVFITAMTLGASHTDAHDCLDWPYCPERGAAEDILRDGQKRLTGALAALRGEEKA